jgi:proto-oncogene tyrosine-protein kinase Ret/cadherin 2 type 1 (N-cadherin)
VDPTGEGADDLMQEAIIMATVGTHPNLVSLVGVVTSGVPLILIIAFCENGSLQSQLKKRLLGLGKLIAAPGALQPKLDADIALDIAKGMQHLTDHKLVHRDLAARNVLLDWALVGKVADFGLSRAFAEDEGKTYYKSTTGMMALRWTAPEAMTSLKFSMKTDVWAFGIVLLEIYIDGETPLQRLKNAEVMAEVQSGYTSPKPDGCPDIMYALMLKTWNLEPASRPTFEELVTELSSDAFVDATREDASTPRRNTLFTPHLSGTVPARAELSVEPNCAPQAITKSSEGDVNGDVADTKLYAARSTASMYADMGGLSLLDPEFAPKAVAATTGGTSRTAVVANETYVSGGIVVRNTATTGCTSRNAVVANETYVSGGIVDRNTVTTGSASRSAVVANETYASGEVVATEPATPASAIVETTFDAGVDADDEHLSVASGIAAAATSGAEEDQYLAVSHQPEPDDEEDFDC